MNARRLGVLVWQGAGEALHLRAPWMCLVSGLTLLLVASSLRDLSFGLDEGRFTRELASVIALLFAVVQSVFLSSVLLGDAPARVRSSMLFARGIPRHEWFLARGAIVVVASAGIVVAVRLCAASFSGTVWQDGLMVDLARVTLVASFALLGTVLAEGLVMAGTTTLSLTAISALLPLTTEFPARHGDLMGRTYALVGCLIPPLPTDTGAGEGIAFGVFARIGIVMAAATAAFSLRES